MISDRFLGVLKPYGFSVQNKHTNNCIIEIEKK